MISLTFAFCMIAQVLLPNNKPNEIVAVDDRCAFALREDPNIQTKLILQDLERKTQFRVDSPCAAFVPGSGGNASVQIATADVEESEDGQSTIAVRLVELENGTLAAKAEARVFLPRWAQESISNPSLNLAARPTQISVNERGFVLVDMGKGLFLLLGQDLKGYYWLILGKDFELAIHPAHLQNYTADDVQQRLTAIMNLNQHVACTSMGLPTGFYVDTYQGATVEEYKDGFIKLVQLQEQNDMFVEPEISRIPSQRLDEQNILLFQTIGIIPTDDKNVFQLIECSQSRILENERLFVGKEKEGEEPTLYLSLCPLPLRTTELAEKAPSRSNVLFERKVKVFDVTCSFALDRSVVIIQTSSESSEHFAIDIDISRKETPRVATYELPRTIFGEASDLLIQSGPGLVFFGSSGNKAFAACYDSVKGQWRNLPILSDD